MKLKKVPRHRERCLAPLDSLMDSYLQWRAESRAVGESYRLWRYATASDREAAFEEYVMALDREEHAAHSYMRVVERARAVDM
jgi:hypothetical protein